MGGMTTAKGELTKERILNAAVDLMVVGGLDNLNLDTVLATTKTSKSQLFHYFPGGKKEVRTEATKRQVARVLREDADLHLDSWEAWSDWVDGIVKLHELQLDEDACEVAALAGRALDTDLEDRAIVGEAVDTWFEVLREGLQALKTQDLLRDDAPVDRLAALMLASVEGSAVLDKATRSRRYLESALRTAFDYLLTFRTSNGVK